MTPIVGITGRRVAAELLVGMDARFADRHLEVSFSDFADRVEAAGGVPVTLPFIAARRAKEAMSRVDGLMVTGGQDVDPRVWGGVAEPVTGLDPRRHPMIHDAERDQYEIALVRAAVRQGVPVLGVCRGIQILNVALGGALVEAVPESGVQHLGAYSALSDGDSDHVVEFVNGSLAASIFGTRMQTNSWHHQAVAACGDGLVVSGRASDGVVETIEIPGRAVLGVQWHPEWHARVDPVFDWLVGASRDYCGRATRGGIDERMFSPARPSKGSTS
jgi:putative glutamine amidotransferase